MENQKKIDLFDLTFMAIGGIIGAVFSMVGTGITTGRSVALALLVGMVFTMSQQIHGVHCGYVPALGRYVLPECSGAVPFLTGVSAVVTLVTSVSFSVFGISMAQYLSDLFPALRPYQTIVACVTLVIFFAVASTGAEIFARVINALGILKFIALGLFIALVSPRCRPAALRASPTSSTAA